MVHNNLEVVLSPAHERDDATLAARANNVLLMNIAVPVGVEATARNGNLTLTGVVRYGSERQAAEQAVAGITGVRGVKNKIELSTTPTRSTSPCWCRTRWTATR